MSSSFTLTDDRTHGWHVSQVVKDSVTRAFVAAPFFNFRYYDTVASSVLSLLSSDAAWGTPSKNETATSFDITWTHTVQSWEVRIDGSLVNDDMKLSATITLGASETRYVFDSVELQWTVANIAASAADNYAYLPFRTGVTYQDPAVNQTSELTFGHPSSVGWLNTSASGGNECGIQLLAFWDDNARTGLGVWCDDLVGRGKSFTMLGNAGTNTRFGVRMYGFDNRLGTGGSSDGAIAWSVYLTAMDGEEWDFADYYRQRMVALGHPLQARGRKAVRGGKLSQLMVYVWGDANPVTNPDMIEEMRRFSSHYGLVRENLMFAFYGWNKQGDIDQGEPDWFPSTLSSDVAQSIRTHCQLVPYVNLTSADASTPQYTGLEIDTQRIKDENGDDNTVTISGTVRKIPMYRDSAIRGMVCQHYVKGLVDAIGRFDGVYFDFYSVFGPPVVHNSSWNAAERGEGSEKWMEFQRKTQEDMVALGNSLASEPGDPTGFAIGIEAPIEILLQSAEASGSRFVGTELGVSAGDGVYCLTPLQVSIGEYVDFVHTDGLEHPPNVANYDERLAYLIYSKIIGGGIPTFSRDTPGFNYISYFPQPGEPDYASWYTTHAQPLMDEFAKVIGTNGGFVRQARFFRKMRALPGSLERWHKENGTPTVTVGSVELPSASTPSIASGAYFDESSDQWVVILLNWRGSSQSFTVSMLAADYPNLSGAWDVMELDHDSGSLSLFGTATNTWNSGSLSIPAFEGRYFVLHRQGLRVTAPKIQHQQQSVSPTEGV